MKKYTEDPVKLVAQLQALEQEKEKVVWENLDLTKTVVQMESERMLEQVML